MANFERLGVSPEIIRAIEEEGWCLPTGVQDEAIPLVLGGGDICVAAETGSGKTGAFGLPCLQVVHETLQNKSLITPPTQIRAAGQENTLLPPSIFTLDRNAKDYTVFIDETGIEASCTEDRWRGAKAQIDVLNGKYMFEVEVLPGSNLVRVGCGTAGSGLELGRDAMSFAYGGTGKASWNNSFVDLGPPFGSGDVVGCLIDRVNNCVRFAKNGKVIPGELQIPAALNSNGLRPALCGRRYGARINLSEEMIYPIPDFQPIGLIATQDCERGRATEMERSGPRKPLCLILEPTRDLAQQTYRCLIQFARYLENPSLKISLFAGGIHERGQKEALMQGVDIAVGTLQRIVGHVQAGKLDVSQVKFLVLDEADNLLKFDDRGDILKLKRRFASQSGPRCQTLFFSATLHDPHVRSAIELLTINPTWIDLKGKPTIPDTVHCMIYEIDPKKGSLPCSTPQPAVPVPTDQVHASDPNHGPLGHSKRIKDFKPRVAVAIADALQMKSCLIFCRTNLDCDNMEAYLLSLGGGKKFTGADAGVENPYSCLVVAGMREMAEREASLRYFKEGAVRFLICTDVAARGIDIKELPFLIMMTLPEDPFQFFHRVGRVGRLDKMGLAVILTSTEPEKVWFHKCRNRGQGCKNTKDVEEGGCTIWFDEPKYLKQIEDCVGRQLPRADPVTFSRETCVSMYGKPKDIKVDEAMVQQLKVLDPVTSQLRNYEIKVQEMYTALLGGGMATVLKSR